MRVNDRYHSELAGALVYPLCVIASVANESPSFGVNKHFLGDGDFMLLAGSHFEVERLTARRCDGVNFR